MINNEATLLQTGKAATGTAQAGLFSERNAFYDRIRSRFLQKSAEYMGVALSNWEIESFLKRRYERD